MSTPPQKAARPKLSLTGFSASTPTTPSTVTPKRPSLKLPSLSLPNSFNNLSLSSHYGAILNGPEPDSDDEDSGSSGWKIGDQERIKDELLNVIRGSSISTGSSTKSDGLEEELSGKSRRLISPTSAQSQNSKNENSNEELELNGGSLVDLGKLGEGASGEVRRVRHSPTGMIMAKKVCDFSTDF